MIRCLECDRTAPYATTDDAALAGWERIERQPAGRHTIWMRCPECSEVEPYALPVFRAQVDDRRMLPAGVVQLAGHTSGHSAAHTLIANGREQHTARGFWHAYSATEGGYQLLTFNA